MKNIKCVQIGEHVTELRSIISHFKQEYRRINYNDTSYRIEVICLVQDSEVYAYEYYPTLAEMDSGYENLLKLIAENKEQTI